MAEPGYRFAVRCCESVRVKSGSRKTTSVSNICSIRYGPGEAPVTARRAEAGVGDLDIFQGIFQGEDDGGRDEYGGVRVFFGSFPGR